MARIGGGGGSGGSGWVYISGINVPGGIADQKLFQDTPQNSVLQSCRVSSLSIEVVVKAGYPIVTINGTDHILTRAIAGSHYEGTIAVTLPSAGDLTVKSKTPNDTDGAEDTVAIAYIPPPQILTLAFTGSYPGIQTELKSGDTFQLTGTTDEAADAIQIQDFGAMVSSVEIFVAGTSFVVTGTIADRGNTAQLLSARAKARSAATSAYGPVRDTNVGGGGIELVNVLKCNNRHPMVIWGAITYPIGQGALKGSETATVAFSMADADSVAFVSPTGDLGITNPSLYEDPKTVTRISGSYNDSNNNLRATALRNANAAQTIVDTVVKIANIAATISVSEPAARLRSGGNNGTAPQDHTITITSNQELYVAPTLDPVAGAGTFQGSGFSGGPKIWTRPLRVLDTDTKGNYTWQNLVATNRAGITTNVITGDSTYTLGGFVARSLTFPAFSQQTTLNVAVVTYSKLVAGVFTATNQPAVRMTTQGDHTNTVDKFTVDTLGTNPTTLWWNDVLASSTNSAGTAQITNVEETI